MSLIEPRKEFVIDPHANGNPAVQTSRLPSLTSARLNTLDNTRSDQKNESKIRKIDAKSQIALLFNSFASLQISLMIRGGLLIWQGKLGWTSQGIEPLHGCQIRRFRSGPCPGTPGRNSDRIRISTPRPCTDPETGTKPQVLIKYYIY